MLQHLNNIIWNSQTLCYEYFTLTTKLFNRKYKSIIIIGASLSEPHTSVDCMCRSCVCMSVCLRPYTMNFKWANVIFHENQTSSGSSVVHVLVWRKPAHGTADGDKFCWLVCHDIKSAMHCSLRLAPTMINHLTSNKIKLKYNVICVVHCDLSVRICRIVSYLSTLSL